MALDVSKIYWALDGKVAPEAIEADLRLRKAVEGLEGQLVVHQIIQRTEDWPQRVIVHRSGLRGVGMVYRPERKAKAIVTTNGITGHAACEACGEAIDPWDGFCRHCGAAIISSDWGAR